MSRVAVCQAGKASMSMQQEFFFFKHLFHVLDLGIEQLTQQNTAARMARTVKVARIDRIVVMVDMVIFIVSHR